VKQITAGLEIKKVGENIGNLSINMLANGAMDTILPKLGSPAELEG
jgi:hypothetical protein